MYKYNVDSFIKGLNQLKIELSDYQIQQFIDYYDLLIEWNQVMNLTAITEYEEVIEKHFLDSLALIRVHDLRKKQSVIDVGTGAGFPGIPLKIAFPQLEVVLLDSLNKRIKFLDEIIGKLKLENIKAVHARAEDAARHEDYREGFDLCVSRAVANLSTLSEYDIPFVKQGGYFISYKSGKIEEEVQNAKKAVKLLGGNIKEVVKFSLPDSELERSFVVIEKRERTAKKYPRKAGLPSREPLI